MNKMDLQGVGVSEEIMGIDLGTTNSAVAVIQNGTVPKLLPIGANGKYTVPSCVRWDGVGSDGQPMFTVGDEAYHERYKLSVEYSVKRIMGSGQLVMLAKDEDPTDNIMLTPAQVSAEILRHLANQVEKFYKRITRCIITVPAYFNQLQIQDTMEAAKIAGLDCLQILKEPTSASYIYSQLGYAQSGSVLIYDLGGGTFDVTHMNFLRKDTIPQKQLNSLKRQYGIDLSTSQGADNTAQYFCRVLGTYGDVNLGGDDIDKLAGDRAIEREGLELSDTEKEQLYLAYESFKKANYTGETTKIGEHMISLSQSDVDYGVDQVFYRTLDLMKDIDMSSVKSIVLVGGSTKSQRLRDNLSRAFPGVEISAVLDPDATVALGAGSVAKALYTGKPMMYADVLPLAIGVLVDNTTVQACIPKNTSMPHVTTRTYYTMEDNQKQVTLHVYQGLSEDPKECTYLGRLVLTDIPEGKAGEVVVDVHFILTGQGQLKITSTINGVTRSEELVIDNIFSVNTEEKVADLDDFEATFMPMFEDHSSAEEAKQLFAKRRAVAEGSEERQSIEDEIVSLL